MPIRAIAGQVELNQALPKDLRNYSRVFDKKGLETLLREVAERYPDKYVDISKDLSDQGRFHAQRTGGYSFGFQHMAKSEVAKRLQQKLEQDIQRVLNTVKDPAVRRKKIVELTQAVQSQQVDQVFDEGVKARNPLALQILSGTRGSKSNYNSLVGGDLLYNDTNDNPIPMPVLRTYSQGLSFPEYWASLSGARKGVVDVKLGVANAGYYNKLLNQVSHRNVVVGDDEQEDEYGVDERKKYVRGLPVPVQDRASVGALLARDTGPYKANTVITPKILDSLERGGVKNLIVRSPVARSSPDGGVYAYDVGLDENGRLVQKGDMPGMVNSQGVGEPVTQMGLNSKHTGGVAGAPLVSGFKAYEQMVQIPSTFQGAASHAQGDGTVRLVQKAPAGGHYVWVGDNRHYVPPEQKVTVKAGDSVEAGDTLSNGVPVPEKITAAKGIGEGRRYWVNTMVDLAKGQNMRVDRRNLEMISRGLINHVRLNDFVGDYLPDDIVPYHMIEASWQPREGSQRLLPKKAVGKYLESPILHHTIGVRVTPKMAKEMGELGLDEVEVHDKPPPFNFEMLRASDNLLHDPDPITRMYGSNLSKGLLSAVHRGATSDREGTSFVPSLAAAGDFGREGYFQHKNNKPTILPPEGKPLGKVADDFEIEPLHSMEPPKPPKMPWTTASPKPPASQGNGLPAPGFSSHNSYTPMAGTAAQAKPALQPQAPQSPFQQNHGIPSPWGGVQQRQPPVPQQPQQQLPPQDSFDPNTGTFAPPGTPASPAAPTQPQPQPNAQPQPMNPYLNMAGSAGSSIGAQVVAPRVVQGLTGRSATKLLGPVAGLTAGTLWDAAAGNEITPGSVAENAAGAALAATGPYGLVGGSAAIDAGKNLLGMVTPQDIEERRQGLQTMTDQAFKDPSAIPFSGTAGLTAVTSPVTTARAMIKEKDSLDQAIASSEKQTSHAKGYFADRNAKALNAPASEEVFAQVYQNNRAKADMEMSEFSTDLIKNARPGDFKHVEAMVGEKLKERADVRSQLQMSDSGQIPLTQEQRVKLESRLVDLNKTINATKNELTNPSSFSPATLSKSLLQGATAKPTSEFDNDLLGTPDKLGWNQFNAAARLRGLHGEYADIKKKLSDPKLPFGEQQKLVSKRDELDAKIREERRALKG